MIARRFSSCLALSEILAGYSEEFLEVGPGLVCFRLLAPQFTVVGIDACLKMSPYAILTICLLVYSLSAEGAKATALSICSLRDSIGWFGS